ncbi:hypothetical protein MBLNU230_g7823t1 [Neophaeotheca triangularis]
MAVITIDLLVHVLANTIFHPFVASLLPLCSLALGHALLSSTTINTTVYAAVICIAPLLSWLNRRIAYGPPRHFDRENEVVVITGGGSGLGRLVAEMFAIKGVRVAVLDVKIPSKEEKLENELLNKISWYECDVSNIRAVEKAKVYLEEELGPTSVLINNAAILLGAPFHTLQPSQLHSSLQVNLTAHLTTTRLFLPTLLSRPSGSTILTIASVLGKPPFNPAYLTDYAAAKAGLIAFHHSLSAELRLPSAPAGASNARTVLVTPGQLATKMFEGVETPIPFLGPVVETVELARKVAEAVESGWSGELCLPLYARCVEFVLVLPVGLQRVVRYLAGVDVAMAARWEKMSKGGL